MAALLTTAGIVLVLLAVQDVFHTLFYPGAHGDISDGIAKKIWRGFRRWLPRRLPLAGPVAFVTVVLYWLVSLVVGFALIYLPRLPNAFAFVAGLDPATYQSAFWGSVGVSLGALMTFSTGVYPIHRPLQLIMGSEAVFGFSVLTASMSWILSLYPALEHRRSLAHEATLLHFAEVQGIRRLDDVSDSEVQEILFSLAAMVSTHRNELDQFPIAYYFDEREGRTALAAILPYLAEIAEENNSRPGAAALAAAALGGAIDDLLRLICNFLDRPFTSRTEMLQAYAEDHLRHPVHSIRMATLDDQRMPAKETKGNRGMPA